MQFKNTHFRIISQNYYIKSPQASDPSSKSGDLRQWNSKYTEIERILIQILETSSLA